MIGLHAAGITDVGQVRAGNEDALHVGDSVFAVADGMGGHRAGEVASALALEPIARLDGLVFGDVDQARAALGDAVVEANRTVVDAAAHDRALSGMGTTLTAALFEGRRLHVAHVGDSRAYLLRDGVVIQLTRDHTFVQQLLDDGRITEDEVATHPHRSVITRAIGAQEHVDVDLQTLDLRNGDAILLCSDGLSGVVDDEEIAAVMRSGRPPSEVVTTLVDAANEAGGPDNITAVLLTVVNTHDGLPAAVEATTGADGNALGDRELRVGGTVAAVGVGAGDGDPEAGAAPGAPGPVTTATADGPGATPGSSPPTTDGHDGAAHASADPGDVPPPDSAAGAPDGAPEVTRTTGRSAPTGGGTGPGASATTGEASAGPTEQAATTDSAGATRSGPDGTSGRSPARAVVIRPDVDAATMRPLPGPGPDESLVVDPAVRRRRVASVVVALAVVVGMFVGGGRWLLSRSFFVGIDDEQVVIYKGIPASLGPVELSWVYEETGLTTDLLPDEQVEQLVDGIAAANGTDARRIVDRYREAASSAVDGEDDTDGGTDDEDPTDDPSASTTDGDGGTP